MIDDHICRPEVLLHMQTSTQRAACSLCCNSNSNKNKWIKISDSREDAGCRTLLSSRRDSGSEQRFLVFQHHQSGQRSLRTTLTTVASCVPTHSSAWASHEQGATKQDKLPADKQLAYRELIALLCSFIWAVCSHVRHSGEVFWLVLYGVSNAILHFQAPSSIAKNNMYNKKKVRSKNLNLRHTT